MEPATSVRVEPLGSLFSALKLGDVRFGWFDDRFQRARHMGVVCSGFELAKILLVDDDQDNRTTVFDWLDLENYDVEMAATGSEALDLLGFNAYDLLILDMTLPDISGLEICRKFRDSGGDAPVLFLTGNNSIDFKEMGFNAGADDYLTKPFILRELSVRVRALLRRGKIADSSVLQYSDIRLDPANFSCKRGDEEITLLPKEFALLEFLMRHPEKVFNANALINHVWSSTSAASSDTVRVTLARLRKKLNSQDSEAYVKTVPTVGYKLQR
jgi:DNA-binding response OmpR family regulator